MSEKLIKKIRTPDGDLQIDYTALANLPMAIEDLGTWDIIYDVDTSEEYVETTSTKYATYEEALNDAELETGIYKLEKRYGETKTGSTHIYNAESSILFVSKGIGDESREPVIQQMLFDNFIDYCYDCRFYLPRTRKGYTDLYDTEEFVWTQWSNDPYALESNEYEWFSGFEDAYYKVNQILPEDEEDGIYEVHSPFYPTVFAVRDYVNRKYEALTERITALETEIAQLKGE